VHHWGRTKNIDFMIGHMMICCVNEVLLHSAPHSRLETLICLGMNEVLRHSAPHSHLETLICLGMNEVLRQSALHSQPLLDNIESTWPYKHVLPIHVYGCPMVFLWLSYGCPMVFLWLSCGCPMVFLWLS
jgi:hypothetical protein